MTRSLTKPGSVVTNYRDLLARIAALGDPSPSRCRVYRGQTRDHGKMLATGMRPTKLRSEVIFESCCRILAEDLWKNMKAKDRPSELDLLLFWLQAMAQHYGPGSRYLDVTYSVDVALWFALHAPGEQMTRAVTGPPGAADPQRDLARTDIWTRYHRWVDQPGWLYVFDVPKWEPGKIPKHGELIDLADAPEVFASSQRIRAQQACLMASNSDPARADLSKKFKPPIRVAWPLEGAPHLSWPAEELFPGPERDPWYERFISIPLVYQWDSKANGLTVGRSLPVSLYFPAQVEKVQEFSQRFITVDPPFLHPTLGGLLDFRPDNAKPSHSVRLEEATPIVLEAPFTLRTPPGDSEQWNHVLLSGDIAEEVEAVDAMGHTAGAVSLRNVFVEFSPLEYAGWERVERPGGEIEVLRGAWLALVDSFWALQLCIQPFPVGEMQFVGPIWLRIDTAGGRFMFQSPRKPNAWKDVATLPFVKRLFVILLILREVSPIPKASPFPSLELGVAGGTTKMVIPVGGASAQLLRTTEPRSGAPMYLLRDSHDRSEPFAGPGRRSGALELEVTVPFGKVDAAAIRRAVAQQWSQS